MAENSKIEWTRHTWNPWIGCTEVSPACDHCYARVMMDERYGKVKWGVNKPRLRTSQSTLRQPFRWDRAAMAAGERHTVFCLSLGDIWDNEVDPAWRAEAFATMRATPNLIYLLLSKRIGNAVDMATAAGGLPPNAALGATMVNQVEWDRDCPKLIGAGRETGALFTFASAEPLLGPIGQGAYCPDWVICGGESGRAARDMPEVWALHLRNQTMSRGKAFFMKQMAHKAPIPDELFIRQFPAALQVAA